MTASIPMPLVFVFLYLIASIAAMAVLLRRSMQKTIYSYQNIGLIGGMLFQAVLLIVTVQFCLNVPEDAGRGLRVTYQVLVSFPRRFSYYAMFAIVVLCVLLGISNVELIRREGLYLGHALSLVLAALYLGGTWVIYLLSDHFLARMLTPFGLGENALVLVLDTVVPLFLLLMLCYFECILAGSAIMGWVAAKTVPKYNKDYIIILGCSINKQGGLLPLLRGRVNRAIRFAWEQEIATGKPLLYVPSGGQGPNEIMSEGSAMGFYLMTHGAEEYEVIPEKQSRNTWENLVFSKKIIEERTSKPKVAFATTNYHILRSGILAVRAGLDAEGIAGDTKWYFWPNGFIREFFGILALEMKAHIAVAGILGALCTVIGLVEYFVFLR